MCVVRVVGRKQRIVRCGGRAPLAQVVRFGPAADAHDGSGRPHARARQKEAVQKNRQGQDSETRAEAGKD